MLVDVALHPFGADVAEMVEAAVTAEQAGASGVWVADHFSAKMVGRPWSRDPFVCLGAIAARTARVDVGVLVANMINRHPAQLASAVDSVRSLAPGRVRLGVGSGADPASRFATEHEAIGRVLAPADARRRTLVDYIAALRAIWSGQPSFRPSSDPATPVGFRRLSGVVDGRPCPPIVVGASAWPTIEVALAHADGVNVRASSHLSDLLGRLAGERPPGFEVSVLDTVDDGADDPERRDHLERLGVDRMIIGFSPPHTPARLDRIARLLP